MAVERKVTAEAADAKAGMTIDELGELVQRAMKAGATGTETVGVTTAGFGKLRIRTAKIHILVADTAGE